MKDGTEETRNTTIPAGKVGKLAFRKRKDNNESKRNAGVDGKFLKI